MPYVTHPWLLDSSPVKCGSQERREYNIKNAASDDAAIFLHSRGYVHHLISSPTDPRSQRCCSHWTDEIGSGVVRPVDPETVAPEKTVTHSSQEEGGHCARPEEVRHAAGPGGRRHR